MPRALSIRSLSLRVGVGVGIRIGIAIALAVAVAVAVAFGFGCGDDDARAPGTTTTPTTTPTPPTTTTTTPTPATPEPVVSASDSAVRDPLAPLLVTDPDVLTALEARGLSLEAVLGATGGSTEALHRTSGRYRAFVALVSLDDSFARMRDPDAVVGLRGTHRLFDPAWLDAPTTRFELAAIVNRIDRRHTTPDGCGEMRLIYRLAYGVGPAGSRLPMTLNVVLPQRRGSDAGCRDVAERWLALERAPDLARALVTGDGPLAHAPPPVRFETNFQSGRWPAGVRPTLGGHAEYVLRVFTLDENEAHISKLENTPTQRMDFDEREAFRQWLVDNARAIDDGWALLPSAFLAERSVSVHPRGFARHANRPYLQLVPDPARTFAAVDFAGLPRVRTPEALLRRLDQMSCKGCHATRSVAGFHVLGEDREGTSAYNAIAVGISPHLREELPWRRRYLEATRDGAPPPPRPFAERGEATGVVGDACGLGDPTYAGWTCAAGNACEDVYGEAVGACAPADGNHAGDAIESGRMVQDRRGLDDRLRNVVADTCAPIDGQTARAARSANGFPSGICIAPCERLGAIEGDRICGSIPNGQGTEFDGFTRCLAAHHQSFDVCLADDSHAVWLRRCDFDTPCRDDYLCVSVPGGEEGQGACLPPYFLFQVRVDGHQVLPEEPPSG